MNDGILKIIFSLTGGVTIYCLLFIASIWYLKKFISNLIDKDLKSYENKLKMETEITIENYKNTFSLHLETKKNEFEKGIQLLINNLSVRSETYRLTAKKRFSLLVRLWEAVRLIEFEANNILIKRNISSFEKVNEMLNSVFMDNYYMERAFFSIEFSANIDDLLADFKWNIENYFNTKRAEDFQKARSKFNELLNLLRDELGSNIS